MASVRVPGFLPSTNGLRFSNDSWPAVPDWNINIAGVMVPIGDASNGMCGGMSYTVRDMFQAGLQPPGDITGPAGGPLFDYIAARLLDSFNLPFGPAIYLDLMNPALPDHETWIEPLGHGRAWRMINEAWPAIRADLDSGILSPVSLVEVKSLSPFDLGKNHQVLAFGYDLIGSALTLHLYDSNNPNDDTVTMSLDIGNPDHTTDVTYSTGSTIWCFFRSSYTFKNPVLATGFGPNEDWTHGAYYGSRGTFFADVTGDGRADAIVVNDDTVTVRRSTGSGFGPNEDWTRGAYYGSRGTFFADVTGDGRADAIVVNDDTVTVRRSTGSRFGPNEDWTAVPITVLEGPSSPTSPGMAEPMRS